MEKYGRAKQDKDGSIIWRMSIACWIIRMPLPCQQREHERTSVLRLYVHCLPCLILQTDRRLIVNLLAVLFDFKQQHWTEDICQGVSSDKRRKNQ